MTVDRLRGFYRRRLNQLKGGEESGREVRVSLLADHLDDVDHPDVTIGQKTKRIGMARPLRDVNRYRRPEISKTVVIQKIQ